jgi:YHS domain-containing protein
MKKVLIAAAVVALAATAFGQAQAATPAKDPMCNMAAQAGSASWQEHYNCWGKPTPTRVSAHAPAGPAKDPMCNMSAQAGSASWQEHYHCWGR